MLYSTTDVDVNQKMKIVHKLGSVSEIPTNVRITFPSLTQAQLYGQCAKILR